MGLIRRYAIALLLVAVALCSTLLLRQFFPYPFLFFFFAAVMSSAWVGGIGPGFFAVLISTLAVDYFFLRPLYSFRISATDGLYFAAFVVCAAVASWVSASKKDTEAALRKARDELESRVAERTAELQNSLAELREKESQREQLENDKSVLSDKLEVRKLVERAKGILQRDLKIDEENAYRTMQRESQRARRSMRDIAESIILNDELKRTSR
jgi:K+-sensing histidine kinase KdpD